jgi:hypothetical protein
MILSSYIDMSCALVQDAAPVNGKLLEAINRDFGER